MRAALEHFSMDRGEKILESNTFFGHELVAIQSSATILGQGVFLVISNLI